MLSDNIEDATKDELLEKIQDLTTQLSALQTLVTERSKVEAALAQEKEQLAVTLLSIGDGVITTDTEGRVILFNPVAQKLTGWTEEEVIGRVLQEIFHIVNEQTGIIVENPVQKVLETGLVRGLANNTVLIARDGTTHIITDSAAPIKNLQTGEVIGVVFVFRDITLEKQLEQELYKTQKLESIGILAGGIAHDFNNILMTLSSNIWLARTELQENLLVSASSKAQESYKLVQELLLEAESAALRAKDLTGQLLTFAKGGAPIKQISSLKSVIEETIRFVLRGSNVRVVFNLPADLWLVEVDANQISQVITNLTINAQQAMPAGGVLTVSAENISAATTTLQTKLLSIPLKPIEYVRLSIQDEGTGITPQILPRIFEPYFTTKNKGSGLGLATAYSIISKHSGFITAFSEMGQGTTFVIYLPATVAGSHSPQSDPLARTENVARKSGRLLIMDDEKSILEIFKRVLTRVGYTVDTALDGESAVELYEAAWLRKEPYKGVLLDLTIPNGMGGVETLGQLQQVNPLVRALVISGYNDSAVLSQHKNYGFAGILTKPFKVDDLYTVVEKLLD